MTTKRKIKIGLIAALILGIAFCAVLGVRVSVKPEAANAASFDHSNCQYPDRTTNPADGCDNSDPCDPANTKGGSGDCTQPGYVETCPGGTPAQGSCSTPEGDKDPTPPDPNRPYYDQYGNKYDYQGNLINAAPQGGSAPATCSGNK